MLKDDGALQEQRLLELLEHNLLSHIIPHRHGARQKHLIDARQVIKHPVRQPNLQSFLMRLPRSSTNGVPLK
jgi:hypothetical protein